MSDIEKARTSESEAIFLNPPGPSRVARRALILAALTCRGSLDTEGSDASAMNARLRQWFERLALGDEADESERALMAAPLGSLEPAGAVRATWNAEGLAVVAWALRRFALPPHDTKVDPFEVTDAVGLLSDDVWLLDQPELRSAEQLTALRDVLYGLHSRLTDFRRHRTTKDARTWFEPAWFEALQLVSPFAVDGDIALDGRTLAEASERHLEECLWITAERHRASIWLVGESRHYAMTVANT
jgi:Domain of unknown function (DUF4272)